MSKERHLFQARLLTQPPVDPVEKILLIIISSLHNHYYNNSLHWSLFICFFNVLSVLPEFSYLIFTTILGGAGVACIQE